MTESRGPALKLLIAFGLVLALFIGYLVLRGLPAGDIDRTPQVLAWLKDPQAHLEWAAQAGERCGEAPFIMPTSGFIGYLWDDTFQVGHRHQGLDIFGGTPVNKTPVYAAYTGYLSRRPEWKSAVIIRIPEDPLQPGRQIWTYYTHMAGPMGDSYIEAAFPPGAKEIAVEAGELLGYQGNFSGTPGSPVGVHLHFSIVLDNGSGQYLNELDINNTLDPSPYLGISLNARTAGEQIPLCSNNVPSQGALFTPTVPGVSRLEAK